MKIETSKLSRPYNWLVHHYTTKAIKSRVHHLKGVVLDIGCGTQPYRDLIDEFCDSYWGIDYIDETSSSKTINVGGDAHFLPFADNSFDSLVAFQVMEHLSEPKQFLEEAKRVLKPGGYFLLTTPFMWGEHEQPHDYYRYTRYGLRHLGESIGLTCVEIVPDTGFWATAVLRFNYWTRRYNKFFFMRPLLRILWLDQYFVLFFERFDTQTTDTATFTTLLRKPV